MNSLFGSLGNAFMNMQKAAAPTTMAATSKTPNILMQAIGAALRHEDPREFMANLAQTHPELKQYDLSNLQQTAQQVCQQKGVDMQSAINQLDNITSSLM